MSRALLLLGCMGGLMWPKKLTDPGTPPKMKFPVTDSLNLTIDQSETSAQIERGLRYHGFSDELITGAIVNAYAESNLDKTVIGRAGERGVFQLQGAEGIRDARWRQTGRHAGLHPWDS